MAKEADQKVPGRDGPEQISGDRDEKACEEHDE
jgi:hypothetical protein